MFDKKSPWSNSTALADEEGPSRTFVIAEAGVNHNGNEALALKLVDAAKLAGADAVKFQLFTAHEQVSSLARTAEYQRQATGHLYMRDMARTYELPWEAHREIAEYCRQEDILYLSSCFDVDAIEFYRSIGGKIIKIASNEITNIELLRSAAATGLPVILSTGMSTIREIAEAVEFFDMGADLTLLHCVSLYPTPLEGLNLRFISTLRTAFGFPVGLSDHTTHQSVGALAVALGAVVVEKHFTVDHKLPGPDHAMACSPEELAAYVESIRSAESALGSFHKALSPEEIRVREVSRRSIVASRGLSKGTVLANEDLAIKRPAGGLAPAARDWLVGRTLKHSIELDEQILWTDIL